MFSMNEKILLSFKILKNVILQKRCIKYTAKVDNKTIQSSLDPSTNVPREIAQHIGTDNLELFSQFPKKLLRKTKKVPENFYLIGQESANTISSTMKKRITTNVPVIEVNPGRGLLTQKLLESGVSNLQLFELNESLFRSLKKEYGERALCVRADFCGLWRLVYLDKLDNENRFGKIFDQVTPRNWNEDVASKIIIATGSIAFFKHLLVSIASNTSLFTYGRHEMYAILPPLLYIHLTCSGEAGYLLYRATSILFQILFEYEFIAKLDRKDFLPWTAKTVSKKFSKLDKFSNIDTNSLYFVRIQPRRNLLDFVPQDQLRQLSFFVKQNCVSRKNRVIPALERWIPYCGQRLIIQSSNPKPKLLHQNVLLHKFSSNCYELSTEQHYSNLNIYTEFKDLSPNEILSLFHTFRHMPEFESSSFNANMEAHMLKQETTEETISEIDNSSEEIIITKQNKQ